MVVEDTFAREKLNIAPRSDKELHEVYDRFLSKWEHKAHRALNQRIVRDPR